MNKKFTMVCASLLLASAFSVNAATVKATPENGKAYYVVNETTTAGLSAGDVYLSTSESKALEGTDDTYFEKIDEAGQWIVVKNGDKYQLKNVETQKLLAFKDGVLNYNEGKQNTFMIDSEGRLVLDGVASETRYLDVTTTSVSLVNAAQASKIYFVETVSTSVTAQDINEAYGQNISLGFAENVSGADVFEKVTAVTITKATTGDNVLAKAFETTGNQFLLMVNGTAKDNAFDLSKEDEWKAFQKAEFVILSSEKVVENVDYSKGYGFAYKIVKGSELVEGTKGEKVVVDSKATYPFTNTIFTATTNTNFNGGLELAQAKTIQPASDGKWADVINTPVYVGIGGLTSNKVVASAKEAVVVTPGKGTAVDVTNLVTSKVIANVYIKNPNGVFSNLLVMSPTANNETESLKGSETNKELPAAQWLVSAVKGENKVEFINLANEDLKVENVALYSTEKAGEYRVMAANSEISDQVIKFETVTPAVENGYLNATESELKGTYKFKFVKNVLGTNAEVYLKATTTGVEYASSEDKASDWTLTKVLKSDSETELDTLAVAPVYNYYNAKGEIVTVNADEKKAKDVVSRAFKYTLSTNIDGVTYYMTANGGLTYSTLSTPACFVIRQASNNRYALANVSTDLAAAYTSTNNLVAGDDNLTALSIGKKYTDATSFSVISEAANTYSYPAASKHVTFEVNGKYIAVNGQDNGILASESSVLKAANDSIIAANFTFYIDSIDAEEAVTPSFYIAHAGKMMVNAEYVKEQAEIAYENDEISLKEKEAIEKEAGIDGQNRVKFVSAKRAEGDTLVIDGKDYANEKAYFKFQIVENEDGDYVLRNTELNEDGSIKNTSYVGTVGDQLVLTTKELAMPVVVSDASAPTSNESVVASEVKVVANNGSVVVKNAAGKNVVVSTILGQVVANEVLTSDNATINVPAGIVVVAVEGESFKVNVK